MRKAFLIAAASIVLAACGPSKDDIQNKTKDLLQQNMSRPELADLKMTVEKVILIKEDGNKYKGQATVILDGKLHQMPMSVLADKENIMYNIDEKDMAFIVQAKMQRMLNPVLPDDYKSLNELCRGGSGDDPKTQSACDKRDSMTQPGTWQ